MLINGEYVFEIQQTRSAGSLIIFQSAMKANSERDISVVIISFQTSVRHHQCKYLKSVRVSADFHGKYQSDEAKEAKHNLCSVFNDIFHFLCFIMMHK